MKELSSSNSTISSILKSSLSSLNWKLFSFVLLIIVMIATLNIITNTLATDSFGDKQYYVGKKNQQGSEGSGIESATTTNTTKYVAVVSGSQQQEKKNIKLLSSSTTPITDLGTEAKNNNNW